MPKKKLNISLIIKSKKEIRKNISNPLIKQEEVFKISRNKNPPKKTRIKIKIIPLNPIIFTMY